LRDGLPDAEVMADAAETRRVPLVYPFTDKPEAGGAIEAAPGVKWLRLPLPFVLDHINVWAIRDGDGWTLVDTGVRSKDCMAAWEQILAGPLEGLPVKRVIVTHMHPDHVGLAGWLTSRFGVRLWMTRLEYLTCRVLVADTGREAPEDGVRFYRASGWSEAQIEAYRARFGGFGKAVHHLPDGYRRMREGETIRIGEHGWRVVMGNGHSPEHACLWCEDLGVLISGDQVLPRISSNVSVWPTEPDADPLDDWLASLAKLKREIPGGALVLPSHGEPFTGLHDRLDALTRGHERSLTRLLRLLAEPKRVVDTFGALFARSIGDDLIGMASGEANAHLNCLVGRGLATVEPDAEGVLWWRAVPNN
jgi:glyoxylase-like metal-dependent hydrolase (beta-lactamase superfamily II)